MHNVVARRRSFIRYAGTHSSRPLTTIVQIVAIQSSSLGRGSVQQPATAAQNVAECSNMVQSQSAGCVQ
ncbi:hypothetical protein E2C01_080071 [Portunus trituberculatus]|uniref:Uncharacterized protein n=1 Tax=Portunus trituberculatus TaxID=210409 RepID=A0A5B7IN62_PORTR|nr:hypothetical protein [Portunus trituberculatus]